MHLLYADDSGVVSDPNTKYSVLAGFATFESQTYWIPKAIDSIMEKHLGRTDIELHASPIRSGKGFWRSIPKATRESILTDCLSYIKANYPRQFILFGAIVNNKHECVSEELFSQLTSRFDKFLKRTKTALTKRRIKYMDFILLNNHNVPKVKFRKRSKQTELCVAEKRAR